MIDDDDVPLSGDGVVGLNVLILLVDDPDERQGNIVLEADCEVGEKKNAFLDDFDVGLKDEVFLNGGVHIVQKIIFFVFLEGNSLMFLVVFILNVLLHLNTQLVT